MLALRRERSLGGYDDNETELIKLLQVGGLLCYSTFSLLHKFENSKLKQNMLKCTSQTDTMYLWQSRNTLLWRWYPARATMLNKECVQVLQCSSEIHLMFCKVLLTFFVGQEVPWTFQDIRYHQPKTLNVNISYPLATVTTEGKIFSFSQM